MTGSSTYFIEKQGRTNNAKNKQVEMYITPTVSQHTILIYLLLIIMRWHVEVS